jgi:electron transfer flavoprotein beta subunit
MNVVVLLAGIADTKWPLGKLALGDGVISGDEKLPRKLSPFDEAALETALKIRDADPESKVGAILIGASQSEQLLRTVASFRLQHVSCMDYALQHRWDVAQLAQISKHALEALEFRPDLVLLGREFGDCDDGALPPQLAEVLGWRFVGLAQQVAVDQGRLKLRRSRGTFDEWITLPVPVVASVTNDKSNRLRHPLLKNVMAAKRESFRVEKAPNPQTRPRLTPSALKLEESSRRAGAACRMLTGPVEVQVAELAAYLRQWRGET